MMIRFDTHDEAPVSSLMGRVVAHSPRACFQSFSGLLFSLVVAFALVSSCLLSGCSGGESLSPKELFGGGESTHGSSQPAASTSQSVAVTGEVQVHFIDVGQADCILVLSDGASLLVDAGNREDGTLVARYLKRLGIERLDVVVATHPHEDHIGGLVDVLKSLPASEVLKPQATASNSTYEAFEKALASNGASVRTPQVGESFTIGEVAVTVLANGEGYGDVSKTSGDNKSSQLNNASIVLRLDAGADSFLLMGDGEIEIEDQLREGGKPIDVDVLKVSHHGSKDGTHRLFLEAVTPRYAVIMCGRNNDYGYPKEKVLDLLEDAGVEVIFRTDNDYTIVAKTSGDGITWLTNIESCDGN